MFISDKFMFNGVSCDEYNVRLVYFENNIVNDMKIPFSISVNSDSKDSIYPVYKEETNIPDQVILNLAYVDETGNLATFSSEIFKRIKTWLITDSFAPFITEDYPDYILYLKCVKIQDKLTFGNQGFLEVTFQPYTHYFYKQFETIILLSGDNATTIENISREVCYPIITAETTDDIINTIEINDMTLKLQLNEPVTVDNKMLTVLNANGENRLSYCNRKWIKLLPGSNNLKLYGYGKVKIKAEFPVIL